MTPAGPLIAVLAAAAASPAATYRELFAWLGGLVLLLLLGFGGYSYYKRWMRQDDGPTKGDRGGFSLSDLRQMHRDGKISTEEYEATRANLVAAAKRQADAMPPVIPNRKPPAAPVAGDDGAGDADPTDGDDRGDDDGDVHPAYRRPPA